MPGKPPWDNLSYEHQLGLEGIHANGGANSAERTSARRFDQTRFRAHTRCIRRNDDVVDQNLDFARGLGAQYAGKQRSLSVLVAGLISILGVLALIAMIFRE